MLMRRSDTIFVTSSEIEGNVLLFPRDTDIRREPQSVHSRERLGGLLRYYHQEAA